MPLHSYRSTGVDEYAVGSGEGHQFVLPKFYKADATRRPVIFCHGIFGTYTNWFDSAGALELAVFAGQGFPVISCDLGGVATWGNDTTQTRIGQAWTFAKTRLGCKTDKFILYLQSQGGPGGLNYARNNPSNVAAIIGECPVLSMQDMIDRAALGGADAGLVSLAGNIISTYGGQAAWDAAKATHDPHLNLSTHVSQAIPTKFWCAPDDIYASYTIAQAWQTAGGAEVVSIGAGGHRPLDVAFHYDPGSFIRTLALP